jgi:hypothetical protein
MRPMRQSTIVPALNAVRSWAVFGALGLAITAMVALHVLRPELDPIAQPVSFYVWGRHGWLLPVALGAFGMALLALMRALAGERTSRPRRILALVGSTLVVTAIVPCDPWFPWERPPTVSGLVHAIGAMLGPALLMYPMLALARPPNPRLGVVLFSILGLYNVALAGSATSLALGFLRDGPPLWIGLLERILAFAAVAWVGLVAWAARTK